MTAEPNDTRQSRGDRVSIAEGRRIRRLRHRLGIGRLGLSPALSSERGIARGAWIRRCGQLRRLRGRLRGLGRSSDRRRSVQFPLQLSSLQLRRNLAANRTDLFCKKSNEPSLVLQEERTQ